MDNDRQTADQRDAAKASADTAHRNGKLPLSTVEYALLIGVLAVVLFGASSLLGDRRAIAAGPSQPATAVVHQQ